MKIKNTSFAYRWRYVMLSTFFLFIGNNAFAQLCGAISGCEIKYNNFGFNSNDNAAEIEYDNFVSGYHTTAIRTGQGTFKVWGQFIQANGTSNYLVPTDVNTTNYPYTGTPLKMTIGGAGMNDTQFFLLTTDGLFVWGGKGGVVSTTINSTNAFLKMVVGGKADGLPTGVSPTQVKIMTATSRSIGIVTCSGEVWMLTQNALNSGDGTTAANDLWHKVTTNQPGNPPLSDIISLRIQVNHAFALQRNGNLWTWGSRTYNGSSAETPNSRAVSVVKPNATKTIKMIGVTYGSDGTSGVSYYVLHTDGSLYAIGANNMRQLGNLTTTTATSWVQPMYSVSSPMNDIQWISPNEHDGLAIAAINVINKQGMVYNWGYNSGNLLGRPMQGQYYDPGIPAGITATDKIMAIVTGGHTSMALKLNEQKMGYAGHYVGGSTGDGSNLDDKIPTFQFIDTFIEVCGTQTPLVQNITSCNVLNLNNAIKSTNVTPADGVIKWFNGINPNTATEIISTTNVPPGTYYAFYYYTSTNNYSAASAPVVASIIGNAGPNAPNINDALTNNYDGVSNAYRIPCGSTTANLTPLTASNKPTPASVVLTWHSSAVASDANKLTAAQLAAVTGATRKIYAAFWDNINGCYSPTKEIVVYAPICANNDDFSATPITYGVGGTLGNIFANDTYNGTVVAVPLSTVGFLGVLWTPMYASVNTTSDGKLVIPPTTPPGIYTYTYSITDLDTDAVGNSNVSYATVTFKVVPDTDGDGINDEDDLDDDNDGILDANECTIDPTTVYVANNFTSVDASIAGSTSDNSKFLTIRPSDFGFTTLGATNVSGWHDFSSFYGLPTGSILVNVQNANVHPTSNQFYTSALTNKTTITISGSVGQYVTFNHGLQYYRTQERGFEFVGGANGLVPFNVQPTSGNWVSGNTGNYYFVRHTTVSVENASLFLANVNPQIIPKKVIVSTNNAIATEYSTYFISLFPECDTDKDGIPNRLDLDSDNDGCSDAYEGDENVLSAHLNANGSIKTNAAGIPNSNNIATVNSNGVPTLVNTGGAADVGGDVAQGIGSSQNALFNACCVNTAIGGTPDSYTKTGISNLVGFANGWPGNVPNGFIAIESKNKGFVITRIASTAAITNPVEGMLIYDLSSSTVKLYYNNAWHSLQKDCN